MAAPRTTGTIVIRDEYGTTLELMSDLDQSEAGKLLELKKKALFLKFLEAHALPLHRSERLGSDSHACRYQALHLRVVYLIEPMLPEQTVDAYLWSHAASQADF
ncbi:unnamed protein product [Protopolystoma xenopodis]|uniref:Uncharacterized protein n=1 Tax=Protopolystoma xenopodis TaxID=117903 RepID=A0A448XEG4_9PLAT|nr:unnamed protein product [Protopolystoma xenopodis]